MAYKESFVPLPEDAIPALVVPPSQRLSHMLSVEPQDTGSTMETNVSAIWLPQANKVMGDLVFEEFTPYSPDRLLFGALNPDAALTELFNEFMEASGSLARSLSSLITVLSTMVCCALKPLLQWFPMPYVCQSFANGFVLQCRYTMIRCRNMKPQANPNRCTIQRSCFHKPIADSPCSSLCYFSIWPS